MLGKTIIYLTLGVLALSPAHCFFSPTKEQSARIKQQKKLCLEILTPVANGVQKYYEENDKMPRKFDDLVPNYLTQIPIELTDPKARPEIFRDIQFNYEYYNFYYHNRSSLDLSSSEMPKELESWRVETYEAIESFRQQEGFYPEELENLVPKYLANTPDDKLAKSSLPEEFKNGIYVYSVLYEFSFQATDTPTGFDGCRWNLKKADWQCDNWFR